MATKKMTPAQKRKAQKIVKESKRTIKKASQPKKGSGRGGRS